MRFRGTADRQLPQVFRGFTGVLPICTGAPTGLTSASESRRNPGVSARPNFRGPFVVPPQKSFPFSDSNPRQAALPELIRTTLGLTFRTLATCCALAQIDYDRHRRSCGPPDLSGAFIFPGYVQRPTMFVGIWLSMILTSYQRGRPEPSYWRLHCFRHCPTMTHSAGLALAFAASHKASGRKFETLPSQSPQAAGQLSALIIAVFQVRNVPDS